MNNKKAKNYIVNSYTNHSNNIAKIKGILSQRGMLPLKGSCTRKHCIALSMYNLLVSNYAEVGAILGQGTLAGGVISQAVLDDAVSGHFMPREEV